MRTLDASVGFRLSKKDLKKFKTKCRTAHRPFGSVLRELVVAFNDDRLRIKPTSNQRQTLEIYDNDD